MDSTSPADNQSNNTSEPTMGRQSPMVGGGGGMTPKSSRMMMIVITVVVVLAGIGGGYWWAKSHTKTVAPVAVRTVKLGFMGPLTGDNANYGQVMQHGLELAQRDFGGTKLNFQLLVRDTVCQKDKAAAATTEMIKAGVIAIIGDTCSGATLAALPIANAEKVLIFSPSASSPALSIPNDFFFRDYPTDSHQGVFTTQFMYQQRHIKKLAILYGDDAYGNGLDGVASTAFKKIGGTVVTNQSFADNETNFQTKLQAIAALKPDALYIMTNAESTGATIVTEAKQLGLTIPIYGSDALKDLNFLSDVGSAGEGMTLVAVTPGNRSFLDEYKATYGSEPANATGAQAYDAFMALAQVIGNGATTGDQIRLALPKVNFQGKSGQINFDANGDLAGGGYLVYTIKEGKFVETTQ